MTKKTKVVAGGQATDTEKTAAQETVENTVAANDIKADVPDMSEEQIKFARINIRKEFNAKFSKWAEIDPEDATDEFIAEAKKDFNDEVELNKNATFEIAVPEDGLALKTAEFLQHWNNTYNHWEKGQWRGVIMFEKVISKLIAGLKEDSTKSFEIDYQTLMFLYYSMMNPNGIGLESARAMAVLENYNEETDAPFEEESPVTYSGVLEKVKMHINGLQATDKKLNILKQRLELAYGGLKMNLKISSLEEFVEFCDAITSTNADSSAKETIEEAQAARQAQ